MPNLAPQPQPVNYRAIWFIGGVAVLVIGLPIVLTHFYRQQAKPAGIVGTFGEPRQVTWHEPVKYIVHEIHAQSTPSPTPHAQPTPCQPCREQTHDYLAAIGTPFPDRANTFEMPPMATPNTEPSPVPAWRIVGDQRF